MSHPDFSDANRRLQKVLTREAFSNEPDRDVVAEAFARRDRERAEEILETIAAINAVADRVNAHPDVRATAILILQNLPRAEAEEKTAWLAAATARICSEP